MLPSTDSIPQENSDGRFWLVNTDEGPHALYMVCTHLGCLFKWDSASGNFKCPCHFSMYTREGHYINGPTSRSFDQFVVEGVKDGEVLAKTKDVGDRIAAPSISVPDADIIVDTGKRIIGKPREMSPASLR